jgi:xanthine dehydrogenase molybdopterin-binding subunit B
LQGIGEPPLLLAVSVHNALQEAVMAFRKDCGIDDLYQLPCPATVEKIRMACNDKIVHKVRNCQSVVSLCSLSL